jgi:hypothetical protein
MRACFGPVRDGIACGLARQWPPEPEERFLLVYFKIRMR